MKRLIRIRRNQAPGGLSGRAWRRLEAAAVTGHDADTMTALRGRRHEPASVALGAQRAVLLAELTTGERRWVLGPLAPAAAMVLLPLTGSGLPVTLEAVGRYGRAWWLTLSSPATGRMTVLASAVHPTPGGLRTQATPQASVQPPPSRVEAG